MHETLGPYRIVGQLGAGGMGVVYQARDPRLDRDVAIKVIRPESTSARMEAALLREARLASSLNHPGIVTIYDILSENGLQCIVMEFVAGTPLYKLIPQHGISPERALALARQIGEAMAAAHAVGIVHRDLKPANILVCAHDRVKILDFGLATFSHPDAADSVTRTMSLFEGRLVGTLAYMAPEQARGEEPDPRADIFSFGVIVWQMLTGSLPFQAANAVALLHAIQTAEPGPLAAARPDIPPAVETVLRRALAKAPAERYQTVGEMLAGLGAAAGEGAPQPGRSLAAACSTCGAAPVPAPASIFPHQPPRPGAENTSIAVLPFRSLSPGADDVYLAAGIASELTSALTGVPGLRIAPHRAAFRLAEADPMEAANTLRTRYVVAGNVSRAGERLRVRVELVDAAAETVVWSRAYDRLLTDIFAVQEEIAKAIVGSLGGQLIRASTDFAYHAPAANLDAWGLVRKAYHIWNYEFSVAGVGQSIALLRRALELDPDYALALAYLGMYLITNVIHRIAPDLEAASAEALECAGRSCRLAPRDPEVLESSAVVWLHTGHYEKAMHCLSRAVAAAQFDLVAWGYLGFAHACGGGLPEVEKARRILADLIADAPDHPSMPYWRQFMAIACLRLDLFEEAAVHARRAVEMQPGFVFNQVLLAEALCRLDRVDEAGQVVATIAGFNPHFTLDVFEDVALRASRSAAVVGQWCGRVKSLGLFSKPMN